MPDTIAKYAVGDTLEVTCSASMNRRVGYKFTVTSVAAHDGGIWYRDKDHPHDGINEHNLKLDKRRDENGINRDFVKPTKELFIF